MCGRRAAYPAGLFWWRPEQLRIDEVGIRVARRGTTVQLRWEELDNVDVVAVRSGISGLTWASVWSTRYLVARPVGDSRSPRTGRSRLWDSRSKAYTLEVETFREPPSAVETFREPPSAVEAALARYAGHRYRAGKSVS